MLTSELPNGKAKRINPPAAHKNPTVRERAMADLRRHPTVSIPVGGIALGMGQTLAYKAAADGTLPTIMVGRRRMVLSSKVMNMLGLPAATPAQEAA